MDPLTASQLQDSHDLQDWTPATDPATDLFSHVRCRDSIFDGYGEQGEQLTPLGTPITQPAKNDRDTIREIHLQAILK